jgi:hypothetical protein
MMGPNIYTLGPPPWAGRQAIAARVSGAVTFHPEQVPRLLLMAVLLSLLGCIPALGEEIGWLRERTAFSPPDSCSPAPWWS